MRAIAALAEIKGGQVVTPPLVGQFCPDIKWFGSPRFWSLVWIHPLLPDVRGQSRTDRHNTRLESLLL